VEIFLFMSKKRILVVDDEEDLTWTISKHLYRNGNREKREILCANSGRIALKILNEKKVDLVLTDLRMPEINGYELLDYLAKSYPETKVIVMTAFGTTELESKLSNMSVLGYIEKPFEINELRNMVENVLI